MRRGIARHAHANLTRLKSIPVDSRQPATMRANLRGPT